MKLSNRLAKLEAQVSTPAQSAEGAGERLAAFLQSIADRLGESGALESSSAEKVEADRAVPRRRDGEAPAAYLGRVCSELGQ